MISIHDIAFMECLLAIIVLVFTARTNVRKRVKLTSLFILITSIVILILPKLFNVNLPQIILLPQDIYGAGTQGLVNIIPSLFIVTISIFIWQWLEGGFKMESDK